jgi:hypothetical protein
VLNVAKFLKAVMTAMIFSHGNFVLVGASGLVEIFIGQIGQKNLVVSSKRKKNVVLSVSLKMKSRRSKV